MLLRQFLMWIPILNQKENIHLCPFEKLRVYCNYLIVYKLILQSFRRYVFLFVNNYADTVILEVNNRANRNYQV